MLHLLPLKYMQSSYHSQGISVKPRRYKVNVFIRIGRALSIVLSQFFQNRDRLLLATISIFAAGTNTGWTAVLAFAFADQFQGAHN